MSPEIPLTAAIVGTLGGCVLGWKLRGGAGPIRSARKRPAGAVHQARTFQPAPELVAAIEVAQLDAELAAQYAHDIGDHLPGDVLFAQLRHVIRECAHNEDWRSCAVHCEKPL